MATHKSDSRAKLQRGNYTFNPLKTIQLEDGMLVSIWQPEDMIVIKVLAFDRWVDKDRGASW